jgi:myo-inositol-1(or 4)-monophosphatase
MKLQQYLEIAESAATAAGARLRNIDRKLVLDRSGRDVKHLADITSEKLIVETLSSASKFSILSEEGGEFGPQTPENYIWVVDPLDGTVNFSQDIKFACISIALWREDNPVLGVVYDFNHEELFSGIVGRGAWCNNLKIDASSVKNPAKAVLATGFPVARDFSSDALKKFMQQIKAFKKIRLLGSAALSLAYVACGRCDAYTEEDIMFWDAAAGIALVKSAGGFVKHHDSSRKKWAKTVLAGETFR